MICCFQLLLLFLGLVLRHDNVFQKKSEKSLFGKYWRNTAFSSFLSDFKGLLPVLSQLLATESPVK